MAFYIIQEHFIRNIRAKFSFPDLPQSLVTRKNSGGGISDLHISDQYLIKKNCHNSRTSVILTE